MGFWDVLGRIVQGKLPFEATATRDTTWDDDDAPTVDYAEERQAKKASQHYAHDLYDDRGVKHPPVVSACNARTDLHPETFDLWVTIRNESEREVRLDKMVIFGASFAMNYPLHVGDQRVFKVYSGPLLRNDHYHKAELYYRDEPTKDYFRADHAVDYHFEHEAYTVVGLNLINPIVDI